MKATGMNLAPEPRPWSPEAVIARLRQRVAGFGPATKKATTATGVPYVTLTSGGVKPEGNRMVDWAWHGTVKEAEDAFMAVFAEYLAREARGDRLYLRTTPQLIHRAADGHVLADWGDKMYAIRCRLAVSTPPAEQTQAAA